MNTLKSIFQKFVVQGTFTEAIPYGSGHINDTYLVKTSESDCPDYILQRINNAIFTDVPALQENIQKVTRHLQQNISKTNQPEPERKALTLLPSLDGSLFYIDNQANYWRMFLFIRESVSYDRVPSEQLAFEGGKAFGQFQKQLSDFDAGQLHITIPNFHNIRERLNSFYQAIKMADKTRLMECRSDIEAVECRTPEILAFYTKIEQGDFPLRVTHNDTKFNNILFDTNGKALCIIDLDTVMPGTVLFDFGDAIRTVANTALEDEPDVTLVHFNVDFYTAYARGFMTETKQLLTPAERAWLAFAPRYMTFIIGLRFLTDYLNNDVYFKIKYPQHNLVRARNQFALLSSMENQAAKMQLNTIN